MSDPAGRRGILLIPLLICLSLVPGCAQPFKAAPAWKAKTPPSSTRWTAQVSPTNALPDYPRPQLVRREWQNLNGVWQFVAATAGKAPPINQDLPERVLVPFPIE